VVKGSQNVTVILWLGYSYLCRWFVLSECFFFEYSEHESVNTKCRMDWQVQFTITDSTAKRKVSNK